ncbi:MAG: prephenate dehydratase domain-containing protein [Longimicrobiales bacterium]|nr:prephenate dehydratase domain-containing protein [Longimicrobiales bacterium]
MRIGFQGEAGAFSEEAVLTLLPSALPVPHRTFREVVRSVEAGDDDAGLLPVENTLAGGVAASFDALAAGNVHVIREVVIGIRHCLLGMPGAAVSGLREVRSHPVALAQCERFFQDHPQLNPVAAHDTAGSAREVAEAGDPGVAAIAARGAARRYGLAILAEDLQDRDDNQTRFLLVVRDKRPTDGSAPALGNFKTAVIVEIENRPGALYHLLGVFAERGLDLTFVESRPAGTPWTYRFVLEFRHASRHEAEDALRVTSEMSRGVQVLGTYVPHGGEAEGVVETT